MMNVNHVKTKTQTGPVVSLGEVKIIAKDNEGCDLALSGFNLLEISNSNRGMPQRVIGQSGERLYTCSEGRNVKVVLQGLLHHYSDASLLRSRFFANTPGAYTIILQNSFMLSGKFVITAYNAVGQGGQLAKVNLVLQSAGQVDYSEL